MKTNSLDEIVKCNIDISNPVSSDAAFDTILLVVPEPEAVGVKTMSKATAISKADELLDYGFTTEDEAYVAATVAFSQSPAPAELIVCIRKDDETISTALTRANNEAEFYGIHITAFKTLDDVVETIEWTEANKKMFCFEYDDYATCPVSNFAYYRSFGMYTGDADGYATNEQPEENQYAALAWMAKCFGYAPGTETWHLKTLATIVPSKLSTEQKKDLDSKHINTYRRYAGSNVTFGGYVLAGEWIDVIRFRDWLQAEMQKRVYNVIKANRKVPYTDNGIGLVEGAMEATLIKGQDIGGIAETEYDEDGNATPGFEVHVPTASSLTEEERKSRKLPNCRFKAKLAGAIHLVDGIEGCLTF